jgi:hypothetical protein
LSVNLDGNLLVPGHVTKYTTAEIIEKSGLAILQLEKDISRQLNVSAPSLWNVPASTSLHRGVTTRLDLLPSKR